MASDGSRRVSREVRKLEVVGDGGLEDSRDWQYSPAGAWRDQESAAGG